MAESQWTKGLFSSCGGCGPVMGVCCCTPCFYGRTAHRLKHFPKQPDETGFSWFNSDCLIMYFAACFGVACLPAMFKRTEQREKFNIPGTTMGDFCLSCWCTCCTMTQQELDIKTRAEQARLVDSNGAPNDAYAKHDGTMVYQPPQGAPMNGAAAMDGAEKH